MSTTYSIRVDEKVKKSFLATAKAKGLEGGMILRRFMEYYNQNPNIIKFDIDDKLFDAIFDDKKISEKLEKISSKLDDLGL